MAAWDEGGTLAERLAADPDVTLDRATLDACFTTDRFLANATIIFDRLEGSELLR
jgi:hypothetical protein